LPPARRPAYHPDMFTPDQERWAEALVVMQIHGDRAALQVCERIGSLALNGDLAGMHRWKEIALQMQQVSEAEGRRH
jgi:hypothetical protein